MDLLKCFYTFMTALFASLIMVPFLRKWAIEQGSVDVPDERKVHDTPMPRLGGIAIFLAFLISVLTYVPVTDAVRGILVGGLILFVTGLVDDMYQLSAKRKFAGEVAACLAAVVIGHLYLTDLGNLFFFGRIVLPVWLGVPFTVFAVVGVINAINLIDGLDGLAGGVSIISLMAFTMIGLLDGDEITVMLAVALVGAVMGFLKYNFYPARIFMGDAGSLVVGYLLGFMAVHLTQRPDATISPMVPIMVLGLPLLDTVWVMGRRIRHHLSPFEPDRTHVHHKFLDLGFAHRFTVLIIYAVSLFWACSAILFRNWPEYLLVLYLFVTAIVGYKLLKHLLEHRDQYSFLQRDADSAFKQSELYRRAADMIDRLVPVIQVLLVVYLALAVFSVWSHSVVPWQIALVLLAIGLVLNLRSGVRDREFLLLIVYVVGLLGAYEVWHFEDVALLDVSIKRYGDILLAIVGVIAGVKVLLRREGEFFLSTPDYLALAVCTFLAIASGKAALGLNLNGPLLRAVIVLFGIRAMIAHHPKNHQYSVWGAFGLLVVIAAMGLLG